MHRFTRGIILIAIGSVLCTTLAKKVCYECSGVNCQRTNYNKTIECVNDLDVCVTIFDGGRVKAQGCLQNLAEDFRRKCRIPVGKLSRPVNSQECQMCLSNLCNNEGPKGFECIQCNSEKDDKCRSNPTLLMAKQCPISRANNVYCYVSDDGTRTVRGCAGMIDEQTDCLNKKDCMLCSPLDLGVCNQEQIERNGGGNGENSAGNSINAVNVITLWLCSIVLAAGIYQS